MQILITILDTIGSVLVLVASILIITICIKGVRVKVWRK